MVINKKANYLLIPLAVLVWGMAIYRIVEAVSPSEEREYVPSATGNGNGRAEAKGGWVDSLQLDYSDPFLKDKAVAGTEEKEPSQAALPVEGSMQQELFWPEVQYLGEIKAAHSGKSVVMLRVNGQGKMLRTGDELQGITYVKRTKSGVLLEYQGQRKEIGQ